MPERNEDPADGRYARGQSERIELHTDDADAERRCGPFVAADREHPAAGPSSPSVRNHETDDHERHEQNGRVALRMGTCADIESEQTRRLHVDAFEPAGERTVLED